MVTFRRLPVLLLLTICTTLAAAPPQEAPAEKAKAPAAKERTAKPKAPQFLRLVRDENKEPLLMQTAIVRYTPATGKNKLTVDLVSAVHIGDKAYYERLNKEFEQYDVVLYELVAPAGTKIPKGGKRDRNNPISILQDMTKDMLQLESQMELVDYTKDNFVHADMTPKQIAAAMKERGEDGLTVALKVFGEALQQQNRMNKEIENNPQLRRAMRGANPLSMMLSPNGGMKIKRLMAEQFAAAGATGMELGPTLNTMLVEDRNKVALDVFKKELIKGSKKIAIFYGAAHMPDFEKRLKDEYGLKRTTARWISAWDFQNEAPQEEKRSPFESFLRMLE